MCNFSHVHCHSQYSMLDGLSSIELYITECQKLGFDALAITDHGNMHGVVELYNYAKSANIHSVMGVEFYSTAFGIDLSDKNRQQNHLLALAQTQDGYQNLLKLSQISYVDGFYYKPRISIMELEKYNKGLVVTSGCMAAHIPQAIIDGNFVQPGKNFDINALQMCLTKLHLTGLAKDKSVGLPLIGCGIGGGDWEEVREFITQFADENDINITIVEYNTNN